MEAIIYIQSSQMKHFFLISVRQRPLVETMIKNKENK